MDPNQWAYNQAYRINAAAASGIPTNLPFIEQGAPPVQGTGVLPGHPSLSQPRGLGGLPGVNYGHPAFGTVSQFLDTMSSLATPLATSSSPYKAVTVGQTAYTLESPPRNSEPRLISTPTNPVSSVSPPKSWELSSFIPTSAASSNPFSGLPPDLATTATFNTLPVEPPPAHSRNPPSARASTIQRNPYQKDYMDPTLLPVTAHSGGSRNNNQGVPSYSSIITEQREPPIAHSHSSQFCSYGPGLNSGVPQRSHQSSHLSSHQSSSSMRSSSMSNFSSSPQVAPQQQQSHQSIQESFSYGRGISNNTFVDSNKLSSHLDTTYEARHSQSQNSPVTTWASSHPIHQPLKQQESQSTLSSPHSHMGSPHMVPSISEQSPLHQPSPNNHNVGSPQVGMSLGSPQSGSSSVPPPPTSVQAIPDSTTKPRKRSRKKKDEKPPEVLTPYESSQASLQQPVFQSTTDLTFPTYTPKYNPGPLSYPPEAAGNGGETIFMTNAFGNSFVNPNEAMGMSKVDHQDYGDPNIGMGSSGSGHSSSKPSAAQQEVDEEFAHLVSTPTIGEGGGGGSSSGGGNSGSAGLNMTSGGGGGGSIGDNNPAPTNQSSTSEQPEGDKPPGKSSSAFQNSFLSFLQGNKPETLSSVTNSNVQRPPMPKYVPDNRPIIPPEPKFRSRSDDSQSPPRNKERKKRRSDTDASTVTFSDDEDINSGKVNKTVESFLSMDEDGGSGKKFSGGAQVARRGRGPKGSIGAKIKGRSPGGKKRKLDWDDDEDFDAVEILDDDIIEEVEPKQSKSRKARSPSPVVARERSSRRAKDKVEEKRKQKEEKKKRKSQYVDTESDLSDDPVNEPKETDYDSDRDPVWRPTALPDFLPPPHDSDDDGTGNKKKLGKGRKFRLMPLKPSPSNRSRGRPIQSSSYSHSSPLTPIEKDDPGAQPVPEPVHLPSDEEVDESEPVHRFMKGDFVIERKDMSNHDSYPIWKIDAGRLIQKFEPQEQDGRLIHKALSTYSSWSDAIKNQFKAIKVRILQVGRAVGSEQVEVLERFRPLPPDANDEEEDELMPFFNIYMQILISQALEPGFLAAINEEKDEYYHGPLKRVDAIIESSLKELETVIRWKDIFKDHICLYPDCKVLERTNVTMPCQITTNVPAPLANRAVLLAGEAYEPETLEPLPAKTQAKREYLCNMNSIRYLNTYHGLKHYRHKTYQNCLSKVVSLKEANKDLENRDLLDQCLQNRNWVQKMFRDLKTLTLKATTKT